jgi:hypothetical protein
VIVVRFAGEHSSVAAAEAAVEAAAVEAADGVDSWPQAASSKLAAAMVRMGASRRRDMTLL